MIEYTGGIRDFGYIGGVIATTVVNGNTYRSLSVWETTNGHMTCDQIIAAAEDARTELRRMIAGKDD